MHKRYLQAVARAFFLLMLMTMLCGCESVIDEENTIEPVSNDTIVEAAAPADLPETEAVTDERIADEQALSAIRAYCYKKNPDLERMVNTEEYLIYWDISSSDENEIVVLFRSYTGAQVRYYIDRVTGDTYVTEFVPGITPEEERTDESFNVKDYCTGD